MQGLLHIFKLTKNLIYPSLLVRVTNAFDIWQFSQGWQSLYPHGHKTLEHEFCTHYDILDKRRI